MSAKLTKHYFLAFFLKIFLKVKNFDMKFVPFRRIFLFIFCPSKYEHNLFHKRRKRS